MTIIQTPAGSNTPSAFTSSVTTATPAPEVPQVGTVQGVAVPLPLTMTLAPALGVTLPIILVLLVMIAVLLVCLYQFRNKRWALNGEEGGRGEEVYCAFMWCEVMLKSHDLLM